MFRIIPKVPIFLFRLFIIMMIKHGQNFFVRLCMNMFVMMIQQIKDEMKIVDVATVYLFFQFSISLSLLDLCGQDSFIKQNKNS